jgi:hypothetical protein
LRKLIVTIGLAGVIALGAGGAAQGSTVKVSGKRCGTTYTPSCTKPSVSFSTPSPQCITAGAFYALPTLTFVSNAGIRSISVALSDPSSVKNISFKGEGPTQYKLKGVKFRTAGLKAGAHHLKVSVKDVKGKTASKTIRFSICVAKPVFTG